MKNKIIMVGNIHRIYHGLLEEMYDVGKKKIISLKIYKILTQIIYNQRIPFYTYTNSELDTLHRKFHNSTSKFNSDSNKLTFFCLIQNKNSTTKEQQHKLNQITKSQTYDS